MRIFFEESRSGKTFDAKRKHQALDSAWLLDECSGNKPVYEVTNEDLMSLRTAYDNMPVHRGKSSADAGLSLAEWTARGIAMKKAQKEAAANAKKLEKTEKDARVRLVAPARIRFQKTSKNKVGLAAGTINRHSGRGGSVCLNSPARLLSGATAGFMPLREAVD